MNCEEYKELMAIQIFGKLTESEADQLHRHIQDCGECSEIHRKSVSIQQEIEAQQSPDTEPDWEASWEKINRHVPETDRGLVFTMPLKRWAIAASLIIVIFVAGFLAGRRMLKQPKETGHEPFPHTLTQQTPSQWQQYADRMTPLLAGFTNRGPVDQPEEIRQLEQKMIREMLVQTRLLKTIAGQNRLSRMHVFLEDLDFVLTSMSNLHPQDRHSAEYISKIIREKDIKFKLRALMRDQETL
jgi:hypothetical protein